MNYQSKKSTMLSLPIAVTTPIESIQSNQNNFHTISQWDPELPGWNSTKYLSENDIWMGNKIVKVEGLENSERYKVSFEYRVIAGNIGSDDWIDLFRDYKSKRHPWPINAERSSIVH